ncbi:MAG: FHA domain-containing protein [Acidobacteriota bacterium]
MKKTPVQELWLKFTDATGHEQRLRLDEAELTVGRHSTNDVCIPDSRLSREHIKIVKIGLDFLVSDSGSTNGTTLNDVVLAGEVKVGAGDRLDLGKGVVIELSSSEFDAAAAAEGDDKAADAGAAPESVAEPSPGQSAGSPPVPAGGDGGIPTSLFIIAPVLGLFVLLFAGAILYFLVGGNSSKPGSNEFVYSGNDPIENDRPTKTPKDDPPSKGTTPTPGGASTPTIVDPPGNTSDPDPIPTPAAKDPGSDAGKCEQNGSAFLRRIAQNEPRAFLTGEQALIVSGKVKQISSSSAVADNINSARKNSAQIKALAAAKNLKPQLLVTAALAKLGTTKGDALQTAQAMAETLDKLGTQLGSELANDALLMMAAYDQGAGGDFMKMRNMLQDLATKAPESARAIRTIWYLHKNGKISDGEYDFALRFLAIGIITQNPKDFGVNAEALTF